MPNHLQCRPASFGEDCRHFRCDFGLQCQGHPKICICQRSHKLASDWSRFVDVQRWNLTSFGIVAAVCVPRKASFLSNKILIVLFCNTVTVSVGGSVGERCRHDSHCSAVRGSGAVCRCRTCQCRRRSHVPDARGEVCGPGWSSSACLAVAGHTKFFSGFPSQRCSWATDAASTMPSATVESTCNVATRVSTTTRTNAGRRASARARTCWWEAPVTQVRTLAS